MFFGKTKPAGIRTKLTIWMSLVLATSLAAGFLWVHFGLRSVLAAKNDAFLERKAAELSAVLREDRSGGTEGLLSEIRREVAAYAEEGLVVVVRSPGNVLVAPSSDKSRVLADRLALSGLGKMPATITLPGSAERYRVVRSDLGAPGSTLELEVGLSLAETESTLAQFDGRVAAGGLVFLMFAVLGGLFLSRQALRQVGVSIRTASRLKPENLSARLPRTGARDELDELAGTINGLLDRLAAYHVQITRFTADASHELRSPLAAMRAAIEVALSRPRDEEEYRSVLASLSEQCERVTGLVNGLLLLARADAGEVDLRRESVDLAALVADIVDTYAPFAEEHGVALVARSSPAVIFGDSSRLRQLVINLIDNAIKFTGSGGTVTLHVEPGDTHARLIVRDTGEGIPESSLPHIFERFYQVSSARSSGSCGLGLSICRWIVEAHGGSIEVKSREGSGTSILVTLPIARPNSPEPSLRYAEVGSASARNDRHE
jgi:heavy metal sensor kinase